MDFSNSPSWVQFGVAESWELMQEGTDWKCGAPWVQQAYAWFYGRLAASFRDTYSKPLENVLAIGPPPRLVPFPCSTEQKSRSCCFESGCIAFVAVDSNGSAEHSVQTGENDQIYENAYVAAQYVYDIFRDFDRTVGFPQIELNVPRAEGSSLSLSVMIAALCRILKVKIPDTILASGCYDREKIRLQPVNEETLSQKITAATRFGYRKFFLVENQRGTLDGRSLTPQELLESLKERGFVPSDTNLEFIEVSELPMFALLQILGELPPSEGTKIVEFMAAFCNRFLWTESRFQQMLETLSESETLLVRHVALDMLCRYELHAGRSVSAEAYRSRIPPLQPRDYPFGPLGSYLKYEESASRSILKLDLGIWNADDSDHQLVERILERQKGFITDHIADMEDIRVAIAAANTKARRLFFLGRLQRNRELLLQAWNELTFCHEYWSDIFDYTDKQGRTSENFQRQWNQCVTCMEDFWHLTGRRLPTPFFPDHFELSDEVDAYTLTAWLLWSMMNGSAKDISLKYFLELADRQYERWRGYPNFLPYEKLLVYHLGTEEDRIHARDQLSRAAHLEKPENGMIVLLAMRTAYVLKDERVLGDAYEILTVSTLQSISDELRRSPEEFVYRCPY